MKPLLILILSFALTFGTEVQAQSIYIQGMLGYYITNDSDTVKGRFWIPFDRESGKLESNVIRFQILSHDVDSNKFVLYPQNAKSVFLEKRDGENLRLETYEYMDSAYCFVKCLANGKLSCLLISESFDFRNTYLQKYKDKKDESDIPLKHGKHSEEYLLVKLKGKKPIKCGNSLFIYRRELASYLNEYPQFAKLLWVKRRDWNFASSLDVLQTFNQLYDKE